MITMLERITGLSRNALEDVLGITVFGMLSIAWAAGFYFLERDVYLTVWHWLIVGLVVFNGIQLGAMVGDVICNERQKETLVGVLGILTLSAFAGGLVFAGFKWWIPLLVKSLSH